MTGAEVAQFPTLTLGVTARGLRMPPSTYLLPADPVRPTASGRLCLGIGNTGSGGLLIIGDTTMSEYYVAFNRQNFSIGWAPRTDACGSV